MTKYVIINENSYPVYADLQDAEVYNNAILGSKWSELSNLEKSQLLVMATRKIDSYNYAGEKVDKDQPLKFPRIMTSGKISDDKILTDLCLQIANYYNTNGTSSGDSSNLLANLKEYKIGDLQVNFKDDVALDLSGLDDLIEQALKDWLMSSSMEIWL